VESEGHAEKDRAVIEGATPQMNWSAEDGIWSSLQYRGEGITHSPIAPRCLRTARYGRTMRDLRRTGGVSDGTRVSGPISESETASNAQPVVGLPHSIRGIVKSCATEESATEVGRRRGQVKAVGKRKETR
jgi:hypothetical protein